MTDSGTPADAHSTTRRVFAIAGSLRSASWNRHLLHAARGLAPASLQLEVYDNLRAIPMFDEDLEAATEGGPASVQALRQSVADADGLLIASPEYNQSIPGVLKNAIDWLSRGRNSPLVGKPVAIVGVTPGPWGTRLSQHALRQTLTSIGTLTMPTPMLYVRDAQAVFDAEGALQDERTRKSLRGVLEAFELWMQRVTPR